MMQETNPFQIRAFIREGITRIPIDVQRHFIQKVADELGLRVEWYIGTKKGKTTVEERNMWADQVQPDEIGLIHSLPVLRLTGKQIGGDPKADFAGLFASIKALYLMEAFTGLTSKDKAAWRKAVATVAEKRPPGAKGLSSSEARKHAKKGWETRNRGVRFTWKSEAREKERKHLIRHWLASDTAASALATLPEFIDDMDGGVYEELRGISPKTLFLICDTPRPKR